MKCCFISQLEAHYVPKYNCKLYHRQLKHVLVWIILSSYLQHGCCVFLVVSAHSWQWRTRVAYSQPGNHGIHIVLLILWDRDSFCSTFCVRLEINISWTFLSCIGWTFSWKTWDSKQLLSIHVHFQNILNCDWDTCTWSTSLRIVNPFRPRLENNFLYKNMMISVLC